MSFIHNVPKLKHMYYILCIVYVCHKRKRKESTCGTSLKIKNESDKIPRVAIRLAPLDCLFLIISSFLLYSLNILSTIIENSRE